MPGESDLARLLATLDIRQREGVFAFVNLPAGAALPDLPISAVITEVEGTTLVLRQSDAEDAGLVPEFAAAWLTPTVHSSLDAVGLTAAVSTALAVAGIPCNILAGYHHDHLLVPADQVEEAINALVALAERPELSGRGEA